MSAPRSVPCAKREMRPRRGAGRDGMWALALAAVSVLSPAPASPAPAPEEAANPYARLSIEDLLSLDITSVSKKAEKLLDAAAAIYVITPEDIQRSGFTSIPELLRLAPGIDVGRVKSGTWAISARGFADEYANKLQVMIDGRTVYMPAFAGVLWNAQDAVLADIARIEVIRGPGATLWGANAVNGVVNVITRSSFDTLGGYTQALAGTEEWGGTARYGARLGEDAAFRVYMKYSGYDDTVDPDGKSSHDAWSLLSGGIRADWNVSDQDALVLDVGSNTVRQDERLPIPTLTPPSNPLTDDVLHLSAAHVLARWHHTTSPDSDWTLQLFYDQMRRSDVQGGYAFDTLDADFQHRFRPWDAHEIVWGLGYRSMADRVDDSERVSFDPARDRNDLFSAFVQDEVTLVPDQARMSLGIKLEHNAFTGFEYQPSGRLLWTPDEKQAIWLAVSRAVRTPCRNDTSVRFNFSAVPGIPPVLVRVYGNPDADSETLTAYELGYRAEPTPRTMVDVALFYNVYRNLVVSTFGTPFFEANPVPHVVLPQLLDNLMDGTTFGGELFAAWQVLDTWSLSASLSHLHMRMASDATSNMGEGVEGNSPHWQAQVRSRVDLPYDLSFDAAAYFTGDRLNPDQGINACTRIDVRLAWRPLPKLEASLVGQNLQSPHHAEFQSPFMPLSEVERSFTAALTWQF